MEDYDKGRNLPIYSSKRPVKGFHMLKQEERDLFARHNITVREVPWMLPPGLSPWVSCPSAASLRLPPFGCRPSAASLLLLVVDRCSY